MPTAYSERVSKVRLLAISVVSGLAAAAYLALTILRPPSAPTLTEVTSSIAATEGKAAQPLSPATLQQLTATEPSRPPSLSLPKSINGLNIDGNIQLDEDGQVIVDLALRDLFEFFLSLDGDWSLTQIQQQLPLILRRQGLSPDIVAQVQQLLQRYIDYKTALSTLAEQSLEPWQLLQFRQQLQADHFDSEQANALFGDENSYMAYSLNKYHQQDLEEEHRRGIVADDYHQLGDQDQRSISRYRQTQQQLHELKQLEQLDDDERQQQRLALVGEAATERLEQLDRRRQQWQQQITEFQGYQQQLNRQEGLSAQQRHQQQRDYIAEHFSDNEQRRLQAWVKINQ